MAKQFNIPPQASQLQAPTTSQGLKTAQHWQGPVASRVGREAAATQLMQLLGVGALGGFGARSLMGLRDMVSTNDLNTGHSANLPHPITVYGRPQHPAISPEEEEFPKLAAANDWLSQLGSMGHQGMQAVQHGVGAVGDAVTAAGEQAPKILADVLPNTTTLKPLANDWGIPAGMAALGGGAYGGYKLTDWLLGKERDAAGESELASAEDDYRRALAEQYHAAMMSKTGGDDLGINELADQYAAYVAERGHDKTASLTAAGAIYPPFDQFYSGIFGHDLWSAIKGGTNAAMAATALGTGKLTYDWAKGQNKQELLRKALQRRQLMRQQLSPPPIVALPEEDQVAHAA